MHINGSGGSFVEEIYDLDIDSAWQIGIAVAKEMGIKIAKAYPNKFFFTGLITSKETTLLGGNPIMKEVTFVLQEVENGTEVMVDIHKEKLEVYSMKPQNVETTEFFQLFEKKVQELGNFVTCIRCGAKIAAEYDFCPKCGTKIEK